MSKKDKENLTELEKIIEDFYSGKLDNPRKESKPKNSANCVSKSNNNNHKYFPSVSVFCETPQSTDTLF